VALAACCLRLVPSTRRLGACSLSPLILIRGPNFSQALLMILSSAAMVSSWAGEAWLTSIVNFFIGWSVSSQVVRLPSSCAYLFLLVAGSLLERPRFFLIVLFPCLILSLIILHYPRLTVKLGACSLQLFYFYNFFWPSLKLRKLDLIS